MKFNNNSIYIALEKHNPERYVLLVQVSKKEEESCWLISNWLLMKPTFESEIQYKPINEYDWIEFPKELLFNDQEQIIQNVMNHRPLVVSIQNARNENLFFDYEPSIYNLCSHFELIIKGHVFDKGLLFNIPNKHVMLKRQNK